MTNDQDSLQTFQLCSIHARVPKVQLLLLTNFQILIFNVF